MTMDRTTPVNAYSSCSMQPRRHEGSSFDKLRTSALMVSQSNHVPSWPVLDREKNVWLMP
jgi:hypothetical protein